MQNSPALPQVTVQMLHPLSTDVISAKVHRKTTSIPESLDSLWCSHMTRFPRWKRKLCPWHLESSPTFFDRKPHRIAEGRRWLKLPWKTYFFHKTLCVKGYLGSCWAPHLNQKAFLGQRSHHEEPLYHSTTIPTRSTCCAPTIGNHTLSLNYRNCGWVFSF